MFGYDHTIVEGVAPVETAGDTELDDGEEEVDGEEEGFETFTRFLSSPQRALFFKRQEQSVDERRALNMKRNQDFLQKFRLQKDSIIFHKEAQNSSNVQQERKRNRGMLGCHYPAKKYKHVNGPVSCDLKSLPFRENQIHLLHDILQGCLDCVAPPPIFVTGPGGTGKTEIVNRVLQQLEQSSPNQLLVARIDCSLQGSAGVTCDTPSKIMASFWQDLIYQVRLSLASKTAFLPEATNFSPLVQNIDIQDYHQDDADDPGSDLEQDQHTKPKISTLHHKVPPHLTKIQLMQNDNEPHMKQIKIKDGKNTLGHFNDVSMARAHVSQHMELVKLLEGLPLFCFIILDNAERLQRSVLSDLLLLPQQHCLKMCNIFLSSRNLLSHTASYKGPDTGDFVGSLLEAVSPITIYCEAYVEREKIKEILKSEHVRYQVIRMSEAPKDKIKLYNQVADVLTSSASYDVNDIREFIRLMQLLWSMVIDLPNGGTYASVRNVMKSLVSPRAVSGGDAVHSLVSNFLLISAFLCQHNKSDRDISLFTTKRSQSKGRLPQASESESSKPNSFHIERLLSVCASILAHRGSETSDSVRCDNMGSTAMFYSLKQLFDMDLLNSSTHHQLTSRAQERITSLESTESGELFWHKISENLSCGLSLEEVLSVAEKLEFPLEHYVKLSK